MKFILLLVLSFNIFANSVTDNIQKFDWNGIEVTWIEDNMLPTYDVIVYFADGALSDGRVRGETDMAFNLLRNGTNRFTRNEISDNIEFYGTSMGASVIHEYSTYNVSGLVKDIVPTMKKVCHLFKDSIYPVREVKKEKRLLINQKKNVVNSHGALAAIAFREISLKGTPFSNPVRGKISTIKKITSKNLKRKLKYFNTKVKKKIYLTGPKSVLNIKTIITKECGWSGKANFVRKVSYKYPKHKARIHLVTVPKANQAQVVAGTFLPKGTFENIENLDVVSQYLGGGFTSVLMKELRVKRGLTYTASASASGQKDYGRAVISTFTKEKTIVELITVLKDVLKSKNNGDVTDEDFNIVKDNLIGSFPFQFEKSSRFLRQLMFYDHVGNKYSRFLNYGDNMAKITKSELIAGIKKLFPWNGVDIVVLGEKKLYSKLKKLGPVTVHKYQDYIY